MNPPHPIPYQGSKRHLAHEILRYLPFGTQRLVEPFAGSAALSLAALHHHRVERVLINDIDAALIRLWQQLADYPAQLADQYADLWHRQLGRERAFYDDIRAEFNRTHAPHLFLYLLARCVKAAVRYNFNGEFNQSPDNRRKGTRPATMRQQILRTSALVKDRAEFCSVDYRMVLEQTCSTDVVYLDPPYQGVCKKKDPRYREAVTFDEFVQALEMLNTRSTAYIVSYDGRTGDKRYGLTLPRSLGLHHIEIDAGRSSQATLLGRVEKTIESVYLSSALIERLENKHVETPALPIQLELLETI